MRVALVHDWLTGMRGGEKCLDALCELFPSADLFTLIHARGSVSPTIEERRITTSALQHLPGIRRWYRFCLPAMPAAIESLDLGRYDLVVSTSHCVAKGAVTRPEALHICYVHTPMRYAWDLWPEYLAGRSAAFRLAAAPLLNYLRMWDVTSANRVDRFLANSTFVAQRIRKYYGRASTVLHPPVDTGFFRPDGERREHYLIVAAMVPYKGVELALRAFDGFDRRLVVVGEGHLRSRLVRHAGNNVEFAGRVSDETLRRLYADCRALILPGPEDFGIAPVEAQASGRPVIALGRAGVLDSVHPLNRAPSFISGTAGEHGHARSPAPTGVFFSEPTVEALRAAVVYFERNEQEFEPEALRANALRFDRKIFLERMRSLVEETLADRGQDAVWRAGETPRRMATVTAMWKRRR